jgi:hypothetical protein
VLLEKSHSTPSVRHTRTVVASAKLVLGLSNVDSALKTPSSFISCSFCRFSSAFAGSAKCNAITLKMLCNFFSTSGLSSSCKTVGVQIRSIQKRVLVNHSLLKVTTIRSGPRPTFAFCRVVKYNCISCCSLFHAIIQHSTLPSCACHQNSMPSLHYLPWPDSVP